MIDQAQQRTREMGEENRGLHQQVSSFMSEVSNTISLFLTYQQVRELKEEKTHSQQMIDQAQQRTREMGEENRGLHQQVSSFMSEVSNTISLFLTYQQVRELKEEKTHSQQMIDQAQQRTREMGEENRGLHQQVSSFMSEVVSVRQYYCHRRWNGIEIGVANNY